MAFFERNIETQVAANLLCDELDILCFDEFQVTDIQDMLDMGEKLGWISKVGSVSHSWMPFTHGTKQLWFTRNKFHSFCHLRCLSIVLGFQQFFLSAECRLPPPFSLYIFSMRIEIWSWGQGEGFQDCWLCGSRYLLYLQPNYVNFASSFMFHWSINSGKLDFIRSSHKCIYNYIYNNYIRIFIDIWYISDIYIIINNIYICYIYMLYIYIYVFSPASPFNNSWRAFGSFNRMRPFCHVSLRPRFLLTLGANFMSFHKSWDFNWWP